MTSMAWPPKASNFAFPKQQSESLYFVLPFMIEEKDYESVGTNSFSIVASVNEEDHCLKAFADVQEYTKSSSLYWIDLFGELENTTTTDGTGAYSFENESSNQDFEIKFVELTLKTALVCASAWWSLSHQRYYKF